MVAFERLGLPRERIVHVAQSLFHDHVAAKRLGLTTVWIDRRQERPGSGATPPAEAAPGRRLSEHGVVRDGSHVLIDGALSGLRRAFLVRRGDDATERVRRGR